MGGFTPPRPDSQAGFPNPPATGHGPSVFPGNSAMNFFLLATLGSAALLTTAARASTAYGSINNFDVVNDTGGPCHGFRHH